MSVLTDFLEMRLSQLHCRMNMIPKYLKREGIISSRRDFKMDDLPKIQKEIDETTVAIRAIQKWKADKKKNIKSNGTE